MASMTTSMPTPTTPVPTVTLEQQVLTDIHNKLHTIIFAHIGVIILFMALLAGTGYLGLKAYDKQLDRAQALQTQFDQAQQLAAQSQKQLADIIAADNAARAQETAQQQQIELTTAKRDAQPLPVAVQTGLSISATPTEAAAGLQAAYGGVSGFGSVSTNPQGETLLNRPQTQILTQTKVDFDRITLDLKDETSLYTLEQAKNTSLGTDLATCQDTVTKDAVALADAKKSLAAYDKLTNRSKFRKILGSIGRNAERVAILLVGIELGHKL